MINKFLSIFTILSTIISCSPQESEYFINNRRQIDFSANPNHFNNFENNFENIFQYLNESLKENSKIGDSDIKKCIKYILRYKKIKKFAEEALDQQFLRPQFENVIFILASHYKKIFNDAINSFKKNNNSECALEGVVDKIYTSKIEELKKIEKSKTSIHSEELKDTSKIINLLKKFIETNLGDLMVEKADACFFYATALIYDLKLSDILLKDNEFLIGQINFCEDINKEKLKNIFAKEFLKVNNMYFSQECFNEEKKSQVEILLEDFKYFFNKEFPEINYTNEMHPYLIENKKVVAENIKETVKDFFIEKYQKYEIKFSECCLNLLSVYLKYFDEKDNKNEVAKFLVLYLLTFKSSSNVCNFVFENMGFYMFRYKKFEEKNSKIFNECIDSLITFIDKNYSQMDKKLFELVTNKKIKDGNEKIIQELIDQLNTAKRM